MFQGFVVFVLAFWLFRQPGVADAFNGVVFVAVALMALLFAVILLVYLTIIWPREIMDSLRFRFGPKLTAAERIDYLNGEGRFAKAKTLDEARRWKQIELRDPWNLPWHLVGHWRDRTGPYA